MKFRDRADAARQLAKRLYHLRGSRPLVLAIPRGAVPMGRALADALDGELDVVLVHKIGAPGNPEYAIGAVDEHGRVALTAAASRMGIPESYLRSEAAYQKKALAQRRKQYSPRVSAIDPEGRVVVVVDDGVATGATMLAALRTVMARNPRLLVAAAAVAPPGMTRRLAEVADEVEILHEPRDFFAVGQFFEDFRQVTDDEVMALLEATSLAA